MKEHVSLMQGYALKHFSMIVCTSSDTCTAISLVLAARYSLAQALSGAFQKSSRFMPNIYEAVFLNSRSPNIVYTGHCPKGRTVIKDQEAAACSRVTAQPVQLSQHKLYSVRGSNHDHFQYAFVWVDSK